MNRMISIAVIFLALSSTPMGVAVAQQDVSKADEPVPKGHERFFKELGALARKYPKSAARFRIVDAQPKSEASTPSTSPHDGQGTEAGSFHACCEWTLTSPRKCVTQCKE